MSNNMNINFVNIIWDFTLILTKNTRNISIIDKVVKNLKICAPWPLAPFNIVEEVATPVRRLDKHELKIPLKSISKDLEKFLKKIS